MNYNAIKIMLNDSFNVHLCQLSVLSGNDSGVFSCAERYVYMGMEAYTEGTDDEVAASAVKYLRTDLGMSS
ncbi:MAG: hypothetical protein DWQ44_09015 [Bacteroidetes bacterium]|nr:MAG: hypothetical protein DWQ33_02760 [Bacteroidota bacterium]REK06430.1 MAG: hypothetical protein DWQ39_02805 [Bacteroidota bacterium]REK33196.1 MAG: hypothetical protein DWQ44_09015 [Bacteroidota bacterium]REK47033.1 MAG: hypothetical protein DWQ48_13350 [Bacteroidota bacterium]